MIDKMKIIKAIGVLMVVFVFVGIASYYNEKNSMTLDEYGKANPEALLPAEPQVSDISGSDLSANEVTEKDITAGDILTIDLSGSDISSGNTEKPYISPQRVTYMTEAGDYAEDFYYEPLSEEIKNRITGISYPADDNGNLGITYDDLRVHILHYNFDGMSTEGELICNTYIADDLLDIFYELHRNEYQLERVRLIDEYNGDDTASMEDNNTSCFNYRVVDGTTNLSKHAMGLALDINPFYNPYVTYPNGSIRISPVGSEPYADRTADFPYKIDENDLCYKLFTEHGFTWGGNWNSLKDYQHFQKTP